MKINTSQLVSLSVETMNSTAKDNIDLLQDKSNKSLSYRGVFVYVRHVSLKCFHHFS